MHAGFEHFKAFSQDVKDNQTFQRTKLTMPVLAVGGEKSFGPMQASIMRNVATNVREAVVPNSGHWLMEENPILHRGSHPRLSQRPNRNHVVALTGEHSTLAIQYHFKEGRRAHQRSS